MCAHGIKNNLFHKLENCFNKVLLSTLAFHSLICTHILQLNQLNMSSVPRFPCSLPLVYFKMEIENPPGENVPIGGKLVFEVNREKTLFDEKNV